MDTGVGGSRPESASSLCPLLFWLSDIGERETALPQSCRREGKIESDSRTLLTSGHGHWVEEGHMHKGGFPPFWSFLLSPE